ncbi:isoprenylcysteine carboxylmethyltransferase family protein [Candidatus Bathyarchaeota archaeon]|nr:MAG: isoprenylcysteine carboxylmethyltransferase family protein [Candidatus Bathyarchaeota archaeon]
MPIFASGLGLVLFDTAYFVWIVSELFGAVLVPRLRRRGGATRVKRDRGSGALIIFTVLVSIIIALSLGYAGVGPLPDWVFYPGIFLMLLGVLVRQWAIAVLGRFFSLTVRVAEDHRVVEQGPYRLVRHPSYTGVLITFIGLALAVQSRGRATRPARSLQHLIRLPDDSRRESTIVRTRRRLRELQETHETAHTVHHLVALKVRRDLVTVPSIKLELEDGSELLTCTLQM